MSKRNRGPQKNKPATATPPVAAKKSDVAAPEVVATVAAEAPAPVVTTPSAPVAGARSKAASAAVPGKAGAASKPATEAKPRKAASAASASSSKGRAAQAGAVPDSSSAATMAPPAKRQRASDSNRASGPAVVLGAGELPPLRPTEPAVLAEPTLEVAASIAVASDRAESEAAARLARGSDAESHDRLREAAAFGSSQSLLSTDYYFRQYGAHGLRNLVAEVDDFGFDPHVDAKVKPLLEAVCKRYFRVELVGAENLPTDGKALLVANRAGTLPWDGLVLRTALRTERPELSPLRWLAEDSVIHYPFMGVFMNRLGAVRACPENAERLLTQSRLVAVFPEGAQGSRKLFRDRYRLQRFGRGGYVKLALKLGVPIFPTAIIGAEETNPVLSRSRLLGRVLGSDTAPITPTFPWLGLAGLLPAPVRWRIAVGAPIDLSSYGPKAADDALVVHRLNEQIRSSLQALVDQGKAARGSALFG